MQRTSSAGLVKTILATCAAGATICGTYVLISSTSPFPSSINPANPSSLSTTVLPATPPAPTSALLAPIDPLFPPLPPPTLPPSTPPPTGRDCGTLHLPCLNAESACNNACYAINCLSSHFSLFTYKGRPAPTPPHRRSKQPDAIASHNRQQAGSQFTSPHHGGICGKNPFSMKFRDGLVRAAGEHVLEAYDSDEWPMAASVQGDFEEGSGKVRNALRCTPKRENARAGVLVGQFLMERGRKEGLLRGRTCQGPMERGDFMRVEMDLEGADLRKVGYCLKGEGGVPDCRNDGYQFHLTGLRGDGGRVHEPYELRTDNRYALTRTMADLLWYEDEETSDVMQCRVRVTRSWDWVVVAEVFDGWSISRNQDVGDLWNDHWMEVTGLHYPVSVSKTSDDPGSPLWFRYVPVSGAKTLRAFEWQSDTVGFKGPYCQNTTNAIGEEVFNCEFPC